MRLGVQHFALVSQGVPQLPVQEQLVLQPHWRCREERPEPPGGDGTVGLEHTLEFEQGLVAEADERQIGGLDPTHPKAILDGSCGKRGIALLPCETLFLRRADDLSVAQQAGCAVVIECRNAEDVRVGH